MRVEELCGMGSRELPKVGDKCTIHLYSDSHACQIVKVSPSGKTIWIRRNVVTCENPEGAGHQNWNIHENEFVKVRTNFKTQEDFENPILIETPDNYSFYKVTQRKNGAWRTSGENLYVALGQWHEYYDWSF